MALTRSLRIALLAPALAAGCAPAPLELEPPSILLVVVDCLRADHVGSYGYGRPTTPRLDELAADGVSFRQAFAQSFWTRPSVPTILTGLYPSEHGMLALGRNERGRWIGAALDGSVETLAGRLQAAGYATAMVGYQHQLAREFGLTRGFDYYRYRVGDASSISGRFLEWLGGVDAPRFFAYLHYLDIHWPYCPPESTRDRFDAGDSSVAFCKDWRELRQRLWDGSLVLAEADVARAAARYDEELLALDGKLGELFGALAAADRWRETLVVVTSDHGEEFMEHGQLGHSSGLFDTLLRVPLIFKPPDSWPGPRGVSVDSPVELRALTPTLLDAAGLYEERPAESLVPWLAGRPEEAVVREFVVAESETEVAIRSRGLKLVVGRSGGEARLYDLDQDPGETRDVAAERPSEVARMRRLLGDWHRSLRPVAGAPEVLDDDAVEGLRALGYID